MIPVKDFCPELTHAVEDRARLISGKTHTYWHMEMMVNVEEAGAVEVKFRMGPDRELESKNKWLITSTPKWDAVIEPSKYVRVVVPWRIVEDLLLNPEIRSAQVLWMMSR